MLFGPFLGVFENFSCGGGSRVPRSFLVRLRLRLKHLTTEWMLATVDSLDDRFHLCLAELVEPGFF